MSDQNTLLLGEIKGKLDSLHTTVSSMDGKIDVIDGRLRKVENKSALHGAVAGGVVAIGISLAVESLKKKVGLS